MKREYKKNEVLVSENLKVTKINNKTGAETAFFEKKFTVEKTGKEYIKLYVYVNFGSDKSTVVIKPAGEKKIIDIKTGDVSFIDETELYKGAYQAYLNKKEELNPKITAKKSSKKEEKEVVKTEEKTIEALAE